MKRKVPLYDWKCLRCGMFHVQKPASEVDYCLRCGCDQFYQRLFGEWSLRPVRMGAHVKSGKHAMRQLLYVALVLVGLAALIVLAWQGCDTVLDHGDQAAREMGGVE